jgi:hypothetical protein
VTAGNVADGESHGRDGQSKGQSHAQKANAEKFSATSSEEGDRSIHINYLHLSSSSTEFAPVSQK